MRQMLTTISISQILYEQLKTTRVQWFETFQYTKEHARSQHNGRKSEWERGEQKKEKPKI